MCNTCARYSSLISLSLSLSLLFPAGSRSRQVKGRAKFPGCSWRRQNVKCRIQLPFEAGGPGSQRDRPSHKGGADYWTRGSKWLREKYDIACITATLQAHWGKG